MKQKLISSHIFTSGLLNTEKNASVSEYLAGVSEFVQYLYSHKIC